MAFTGKNPFKILRPLFSVGGFNIESLAGAKVLTFGDSQIQALDPDGSNRDVAMPAVGARAGAWFLIVNRANAAENLVLQQPDASTTLLTLGQNKAALVCCTADGAGAGTAGWSVACIFSTSLT